MSTVGGPRLSTIPKFTNTYSMGFDGVDDIFSLGETPTVGTGGINTLSFWVKANAQSVGGISNYLFSDDEGSYNWWRFFHGNGTNLFWRNINGVVQVNLPNVFDGNWHNIVFIRNPSDLVNGSIRVYVDNGTPTDWTLDYRYGVAGFYNGSLGTIGNRTNVNSGFVGIVDEVSVWNSEITPSDVASIYNNGTPTDLSLLPTPPLNWYRMGDNGSYKSPQWLLPNNENKDLVSNYSLSFDAVDDYVNCGASTLSGETALSISAWVYPTSYGDATAPSFVSTDAASPRAFYLGLYTSTNFRFSLSTNGANLTSIQTAAGTVGLNTWQHILVTWDQVNLKLYKNGVLLNTVPTTFASNGTFTTTNDLLIGARRSTDGLFEGKIDEVAIFNEVVDIADVWDGSGEPTDLSLLATLPINWYRMGEEANFTSNWLIDNSALDNYSKRSFVFDGIDDYVSLNTPIPLGLTSISFWMKSSHSIGNDSITQGLGNLNFIGTTPLVRLAAQNYRYFPNQSSKFDGEWHHWFLLIAGSGINDIDNCRLFIDNVEIIGYDPFKSGTPVAWSVSNIGLGFYGHMSCTIDEFAVWQGSDESANVSTIYNNGTPNDISSLSPTVWLKMGEDASFNGTNWTIPDNVGSNNGTSGGMMVDALVGEAPNYSGGGISEGMDIEDRVGNASNSENNALSYNMEREDRVEDTP